jgi:hypothetical protein
VTGLLRRDVRLHQAIHVTSPARTLLDMAPQIPAKSLTRFVNDGRRQGLITLGALADVAQRFPSHPGAPLLRPHFSVGHAPTRSEFEDVFLPFCQRFGLRTPRLNTIVAGYEVDTYFEAEKLIVELDSWEYHEDRGSFEDDR